MNIEYKSAKMDIKDLDMSKNIISGYASVFGNVDQGNDIMVKGAFSKSIMENGPEGKNRILYLEQHKLTEEPLGSIVELKEDDYGLKFTAKIANTRKGKDYMELIKMGAISENSVGFRKLQYEPNTHGGNDIKEVALWEISAVNIAMNEAAIIMDAKGIVNDELVKSYLSRFDSIANIIRKGDISDQMGYHLEAQIYQLKSVLEQVVTQPSKDTEPMEQVKTDEAILNDFAGEILRGL